MTDPDFIKWGPARKAIKYWQSWAALVAVISGISGYVIRLEVFFQNQYKEHQIQAAMTADTNRIVRLMAQRMGVKP